MENDHIKTNGRSTAVQIPVATGEGLKGHTNNLDKYLEDIYERRVKFRMDKTQIDEIEERVVDIVSQTFTQIMKRRRGNINRLLDYIENVFHSLTFKNVGKVNILKVGSFYEGTKNGYPDEFDFILVFGSCECNSEIESYIYFDDKVIHNDLRHFLEIDKRTHYVGQRGPATKFTVRLLGKEINVDLVPAVLITGVRHITRFGNKISLKCPVEFKDEINRTGSFLLVNGRLSFTQTEVHFMKHVLSQEHKKVYRLCKYLINGSNNYSELMRQKYHSVSLWEFPKGFISTYMIKTEIIRHHYEYESIHDSVGGCVLEILRKLLNIESGKPIHTLTDTSRTPLFYKDEERYTRLKKMITHLESLQSSQKDYNLKECHVTPLNKHLYRLSENTETPQRYKHVSNEFYVCCMNDKLIAAIIAVLMCVFFTVLYFTL